VFAREHITDRAIGRLAAFSCRFLHSVRRFFHSILLSRVSSDLAHRTPACVIAATSPHTCSLDTPTIHGASSPNLEDAPYPLPPAAASSVPLVLSHREADVGPSPSAPYETPVVTPLLRSHRRPRRLGRRGALAPGSQRPYVERTPSSDRTCSPSALTPRLARITGDVTYVLVLPSSLLLLSPSLIAFLSIVLPRPIVPPLPLFSAVISLLPCFRLSLGRRRRAGALSHPPSPFLRRKKRDRGRTAAR